MELSKFGKKFSTDIGILSLMDDLGNALASDKGMLMMGGGNPGFIPEVEQILQKELREILDDPKRFRRLVGIYDPPQGEKEFIEALAELFRKTFQWDVSPKNIALTNGSQTAFFALFNMFAGEFDNQQKKQIQLPLAPEYIGYSDAGLSDNFFVSTRPRIQILENHLFKYFVDFEQLKITNNTGAICVSRPTNPTGNVLTDTEIEKLMSLAKKHQIPLILDNAYGTPFPHIIYTDANPVYNENTIVCMSLSKLGIPASRTGIVIANEETIQILSGINAVTNLSTGSFGPMLALNLIKRGELISMSQNIIKPFYEEKARFAVECAHQSLAGSSYYIHKPEGAMFLWLWFKNLPISSLELYERLKQRGLLVVSGHYFFPGMQDNWQHQHECIRVTYSQDQETIRRGMEIIGEEVKKAYA